MSERIIRKNEMLTEQQCSLIDRALREDAEPRKVAAYLCLHMGLTLSEVTMLQWKDADVSQGMLTLRHSSHTGSGSIPIDPPRILPMPPHIIRYLSKHADLYEDDACYILTGKREPPVLYHMQNVLSSVALKAKLSCPLSATDLRNAFIRRCIQSGMDLYSICAYIGIRQPNVIVNRFAEYFTPQFQIINRIEHFSADDQSPIENTEPAKPKRMNLLILGAGSQGAVVKEIAEAIGMFHKISFLDDDPNNQLAIGRLSDLRNLINEYPLAIPSFGDSRLRKQYMDTCEQHGFIVPSLTHPNATVSPAATIDRSVIIEARSVISSGAVIGRGALVSSGSVIGSGAHIGEFAHVDASATIEKNAAIDALAYVPSGTVVRWERVRAQKDRQPAI